MKEKKKIFLSIIGVLSVLLIAVGVTYSIFIYSKQGENENTITSGKLTFLYTENTGTGTGINITNAFPVSDELGMAYTSDEQVFDFKVESEIIGNVSIPYEVTVSKTESSTLPEEYIKLYLTDTTENEESILVNPITYNELPTSSTKEDEKQIYFDEVEANENYLKKFRLRMWVKEDLSVIEHGGKTFTVKVNVYSNSSVIKQKVNKCVYEIGYEWNFDYTGREQEFTVPCEGTYKLETWGASGGSSVTNHGWGTRDVWDTYGYGGYAAGNINLIAGDKLYAYVGAQGATGILGSGNVTSTTFNGGGSGKSSSDNNDGGGAGGGATDIRLTGGNWDNFDSLKSRIMVAGGGSGSAVVDCNFNNRAGASGGGLKGNGSVWKYENAQVTSHSYNATQTTGYKFGIGENGIAKGNAGGAGAGGGYYGGYASKESIVGGAGGGSGFVSGYEGCDAISENSTSTSITHSGNSLHYSGKAFTNITLKHGNETIIEPNGTESTGHNGNGYARITLVSLD